MKAIKGSSTKTVLRYFWRAFWHYRFFVSLDVAFIMGAVICDSIAPWFLKHIIDGVSTLTPGSAALEAIFPDVIIVSALWGGSWLGWRLSGWVGTYVQPYIMKNLTTMSFEYLLGHSYGFFSDMFAGALVRRVNRIARAFERVMDEFTFRFLSAAIILSSAFVSLALRSLVLAVVFLVWTVIFIGLNIIGSRWKLKLDLERAEMDSKLTGVLSDAITNATTIKVFTRAREEASFFTGVVEAWRLLQMRSWRRGEIVFAVQGALMVGVNITLLVIGVRMWAKGILTVGDLVLIQTYLALVFSRLWDIGRGFRAVYEAISDAREMVDLLELPYEIRDRRGAKTLNVTKGKIEFKDVIFAFNQTRTVLDGLSFTIAPREKVALVGPSGAGKSTITKLLFRFFDLDGGKILIDGQDISKVTQDSLRSRIGLVPQDPILFHRTLRENIGYGNPSASDAEIIEAAKKAHCHEFISQLPDEYESYVGERGIKLSGGERQRIAIARAILKNAPILVLDEATSSLDSESEHYIQEVLHELMKDKTVIVIAHRLSTVMEMDRIIVVEQGRVTDTGTHKSLLKRIGTYQRLWKIQAGGFTTM